MRAVSKVSLGLAIIIGLGAPLALAEDSARVSVTLKDHKFSPAEPSAHRLRRPGSSIHPSA